MNRSLILLDRDGVINRMVVHAEHGTVDSPLHPSQVELVPGAAQALARLTRAGYGLAIVSNQPAWAKGKTTRENLEAVHARVLDELQSSGVTILSSHLCLHRAEDACPCRKPLPGLLREALDAHADRAADGSWMVGDGVTDVQAGKAAGLRTALLGPRKCCFCKVLEESCGVPSFWGDGLEDFARHLLEPSSSPSRAASLRIKVFADGADLAVIRKRAADPLIKGFTTNPSLMRQAGVDDYEAFAREALAAVGPRPISFEVVADEEDEIERQALRIHSWGEHAYVKIPITDTRGQSLCALVRRLSARGVKINVTAVFTLEQVWEAALALQGGAPGIVSVLAGRIADSGRDPIPHMEAALTLCRHADPRIELLWASPREIFNVIQADRVGVDIITVTDDLLARLPHLGKDLAAFSLETVRSLKRDADMGGHSL